VSATPPPAELRARILAAASAEPVPSRPVGVRRTAMVLAVGFLVPIAISLGLGWQRSNDRPLGYIVVLALAWLTVGLAATWGGVSRGRSMLGRPAAARLVVATLTPIALVATALVASLAWPQTLADDATARNDLVCVGFTLLFALGPLVAFAVVRRGSDPVAPRLTGAAIGAASGAWGALAIQLHCGHASPEHVLLAHVLPVAALAVVGVLVGDRVLAVRAEKASR
jgi:hypothetical protein